MRDLQKIAIHRRTPHRTGRSIGLLLILAPICIYAAVYIYYTEFAYYRICIFFYRFDATLLVEVDLSFFRHKVDAGRPNHHGKVHRKNIAY